MTWLEVTVAVAPGLAAELASEALFQAGAAGIEERDPAPDGRLELVAWLPEARLPLDAAPLAALGATVRGVRRVPEQDWQIPFEPVELGARLVVVPSRAPEKKGSDPISQRLLEDGKKKGSDPFFSAGRVAIRLDPGSAFGTGLHPSTALAAALLEEALARGPRSVLDVGTGSGILAIAAYLLGARPVLGIDNDPDAVAEAWSNARRNACRDAFEASDRPLESIAARFDVVVANLDASTHSTLATLLADRVAPGGDLIAGGLRADEPFAAPPGLARAEIRADRGWRAERWTRE